MAKTRLQISCDLSLPSICQGLPSLHLYLMGFCYKKYALTSLNYYHLVLHVSTITSDIGINTYIFSNCRILGKAVSITESCRRSSTESGL